MLSTTSSAVLLLCFIFSNWNVWITDCSVTAQSRTLNSRGISVSLLDHNQIVLAGSDRNDDSTNAINDTINSGIDTASIGKPSSKVSLDGFNLLWLIAWKLRSRNRFSNSKDDTTPTVPLNKSHSNITFDEEVYLDSNTPRQILRYSKKTVPISRILKSSVRDALPISPSVVDHISATRHVGKTSRILHEDSGEPNTKKQDVLDVVKVSQIINGNSIGFEMEFRMEKASGSGYIITGKSLQGFNPLSGGTAGNSTSDEESWFGLHAQSRSTSYMLRLEYRNFAWNRKKQLHVRLSYFFRKGDWQKLSVSIDFATNAITYRVNCSAPKTAFVRANIPQMSTFYNVYRLLQHRARQSIPVKVTFRSVIVTNGNQTDLPRQCQKLKKGSRRAQACTGGKVFMRCGPSCERTCQKNPYIDGESELRTCAIACVTGCHCPAGMVTYRRQCILPSQCPCVIGSLTYGAGAQITMNNERCTCTNSEWKCFDIPRFTHTPRNLTIRLGRTTQIACAVAGNPLPTVEWNGPENAKYRVVEKNGGKISILVLRNTTKHESGKYTCTARVRSSSWKEVKTAIIRVLSPPTITLPKTVSVKWGSPVLVVDCETTGLPPPRIRWLQKGKFFTPNDHVNVYRAGEGVLRLKINHVTSSDAGGWSCIAQNQAGRVIRTVGILVWHPKPNNAAFYRKPVDQYVKRGHTAIFNCQILDHASSTVNVAWEKDDVRLSQTPGHVIVKKYRLILKRIRDEDAGKYACIVTVGRGGTELRAEADLMIKGTMLPWSSWSRCNSTCGGGIRFKRRTCDGVPPNKKTCHGKFIHIKKCNLQVCPGVCTAYGDPHFTSFDGRKFNIHGDCGYVFSQDASGNEFKILLYTKFCGTRLSCLYNMTIILSLPTYAGVIDITREGRVKVNSIDVNLPFTANKDEIFIEKIGMYLILNAGSNFELRWSLPHQIWLTVGPKYFGRTKGLCGNYNSMPGDDNLDPSGRAVESELEFGQSWIVLEGTISLGCKALRPIRQPCEREIELGRTALGACNMLRNERLFGDCHKVVPTARYIETCMFDICSTSVKRTDIYSCISLSAYAEECLRKKIVLDWRTEHICNVPCEGGMIYQECGPRCNRYCPGVINDLGKLCSAHGNCLSGCHCPEGQVLHDGMCISPSQCPCVDAQMTFENGSSHDRNCEQCVCSSGEWQCVFNKDVCDYPSSVVRGPSSQVAPLGYHVMLCCEVVGIPVPEVEWFRNGERIDYSERNTKQISPRGIKTVQGHTKANLYIYNITSRHAGTYTCRAKNALGKQISEKASLTVIADRWVITCDPNPTKKILQLPSGCQVTTANGITERSIDVGQCLGSPCFYNENATGFSKRNAISTCGRQRNCCVASVTSPIEVSCSLSSYSTSFYVTAIKKCACAICEERSTSVEGVLKTAVTGTPVKHVKVIHRGRVMTYTTSTGSFRIKFSSLPEETTHVTLTFVDVIFKRFPSTVKNLPVIFGDVTIHTIFIDNRSSRIRFNASVGLRHLFRVPGGDSNERLRLTIPPSSLILQKSEHPYTGQVDAVFSLVKNNHGLDRRQMQAIPGNFIGINRDGNKKLIIPSYVLSVSLYDLYGRSVEICPGKSAVFVVMSSKFKKRILPWFLDELTGLWRERDTRVDIFPKYKKGTKILFLSAKIPRFNTAWALSESEDPCYLRARVVDCNNNTLPGVRVTMTSSDVMPSSSPESETPQVKTFFEDLTRITDASGTCMPIGCRKYGFLFASKQGNDLMLLRPDKPPPDLGRVTSHKPGYLPSDLGENNDEVSTHTRPVTGRNTKSQMFSYYRMKEDCVRMGTDRHTYVFRDGTLTTKVGGNIVSSRNHQNQIIQTMIMADQENVQATSRRKRNLRCHMKVSVTMPDIIGRMRNAAQVPMIIETFTFSGRNVTDEMKMVGWRRETFKAFYGTKKTSPISRRRNRLGLSSSKQVKEEVCVEYLCNEQFDSDLIVYVTVNAATDNAADGRETSRPTCSFLSDPLMRANGRHEISPGGYVILPSLNRNRAVRDFVGDRITNSPHAKRFGFSFVGMSYLDSKNKCNLARGERFISAWVKCM